MNQPAYFPPGTPSNRVTTTTTQGKSRSAFEATGIVMPAGVSPHHGKGSNLFSWKLWQAAEAYGRKQAREEVIARIDENYIEHGTATGFVVNQIKAELEGLLK